MFTSIAILPYTFGMPKMLASLVMSALTKMVLVVFIPLTERCVGDRWKFFALLVFYVLEFGQAVRPQTGDGS
jgi:hypothetical protein